jgi:hypothetical protein
MLTARVLLAASAVVVAGVAVRAPRSDPAVAAMAAAAGAFLEQLPAELRAKAAFALTDAEHRRWGFVPAAYPGVQLGELDGEQEEAAHALLRAGLSARGYDKAIAIVQLEDVLRELESRPDRVATHRDRGRYAVAVFGEPSASGTWSWRVQGHHVSLRFFVVQGRFAGCTPAFLGSNPHELRTGPARGKRVLGAEEDLARALLLLCDDAQRRAAVIDERAPADILLGPGRAADSLGAPVGLSWAAMSEGQRAVLWRLIGEFAHNLRAEFAERELLRIEAAGPDAIHFAWCGGVERGEGHYYRIHGPQFVIEYDNTQDGANHVHTVWRDLERDFGGDVLRQHLEQEHGAGGRRR